MLRLGWVNVFATVLLTLYGQIVVKWQMNLLGQMPDKFSDKITFLASQFLNPWMLSVFLSAALAAFSWMVAMTKLDLSIAYPFVSLSFPCVLLLSWLFFHEPLNLSKIIGVMLILTGILVTSYGVKP